MEKKGLEMTILKSLATFFFSKYTNEDVASSVRRTNSVSLSVPFFSHFIQYKLSFSRTARPDSFAVFPFRDKKVG